MFQIRLCMLLLSVGVGSAFTLQAQSAEHRFRGCVYVQDTLDDSTSTRLTPVARLPLDISYEALGVFLPTFGSFETNSSGCFEGELSGFTVPRETRLRIHSKLKSSRQGVASGFANTYKIELDTRRSVSGTREDFGDIDFTVSNSSAETHGAMLMWVAQNRAIDLYRERTGGAWDFRRLWVYFPADQPIATGGASGLNIPLDARDRFSDTFLHEVGHFISDADVLRTGLWDDYCATYSGSRYPKDRPPYAYSNPEERVADADCGHSYNSYEHETRAISEGFADATQDFLDNGVCWSGGNPSLHFDGKNRETSIMSLVCRAMDSGTNRRSNLHVYGEREEHLKIVEGIEYGAGALIVGDQAILGNGTDLYQLDLSERNPEPVKWVSLLSYGIDRIEEVFQLGSSVCVRARVPMKSSREILCRSDLILGSAQEKGARKSNRTVQSKLKAKVSPSRRIASFSKGDAGVHLPGGVVLGKFNQWGSSQLPSLATYQYLMDVQATSTHVYLLYLVRLSSGYQVKLMRAPLTENPKREDWVERISFAVGATVSFDSFAVAEGESQIFFADLTTVYRCEGLNCSSVELFAGKLEEAGYTRGKRGVSRLGFIDSLQIQGDDLYIVDQYGVSRAPISGGRASRIEQEVGIGPDAVFANNLSLRSLKSFSPHSPMAGFGVSEDWMLVSGSYLGITESRSSEPKLGLMIADRSIPVLSTVYCGTESVTRSAETVLRMYKKANKFYMDLSDFTQALRESTGMSASSLSELKKFSWLSLNSTGCSFTEGEIIEPLSRDLLAKYETNHSQSSGPNTVPSLLGRATLRDQGRQIFRQKLLRQNQIIQETDLKKQPCGGPVRRQEPAEEDAGGEALKRRTSQAAFFGPVRINRPTRVYPDPPQRIVPLSEQIEKTPKK